MAFWRGWLAFQDKQRYRRIEDTFQGTPVKDCVYGTMFNLAELWSERLLYCVAPYEGYIAGLECYGSVMKKVFGEKSLQSKVDHYWVSLKTDGKTDLKRGGTRLEGD